MRIGLVHQYYLAPGQGGGARFNEMARTWVEAGHEVEVFCGRLDYASGRPLAASGEGGQGLRVRRLWAPERLHRGWTGRALTLAGFGASAAAAIAGAARRLDVVIATSPPLTVAWAGFVAGALGVPVVFEVRDLWPDSAVDLGVIARRSVVASALYGLERAACRSASRVVALTPAIAASIERRGLAHEVAVLPNGAGRAALGPALAPAARRALRAELGWGDRFVILYAGAHGLANGLSTWVEASRRVGKSERLLFVAVGDGPQKRALVESARGVEAAAWLDPVEPERAALLFDAADAGAALLRPAPIFETVYPNKIFDAMARRRPVILNIPGAARRLVEGSRAGVWAEPGDAASLLAAARRLARMPGAERRRMGERGRAFVERRFSRERIALAYLGLLEGLIGGR